MGINLEKIRVWLSCPSRTKLVVRIDSVMVELGGEKIEGLLLGGNQ